MSTRNAVIIRFLLFVLTALGFIFIPAGTRAYWQAWVYCGIVFISLGSMCAYFLKNNPGLLERRMRVMEKEPFQRIIIQLFTALFLFVSLLQGLDHRFGWTTVPFTMVIIADVMVICGFVFCFFVLKENEYASGIIEVEKGQPVVSTGPYAFIRHPMYLAVITLYLFSPLALGSWLAFLAVSPLPILFVFRIIQEEKLLSRELDGYKEYMHKVKYRLIPFLW